MKSLSLLLVLSGLSSITGTKVSGVAGMDLSRYEGEAHPVRVLVVPAAILTCSCKAGVEFLPSNGVVMCSMANGAPIGCQIVWEDVTPEPGVCGVDENNQQCTAVAKAACTADPEPLNLNLLNCWANGVWIEAKGLQNGARFWHTNGDGVSFDPNLRAKCVTGDTTSPEEDEYFIKFFADQTTPDSQSFKIRLKCAHCKED